MLVMLSSTVMAADFSTELKEAATSLEGESLPGPLASLFNNQNVNLEISLNSGEKLVFGVTIKDKVVKKIQTTALDKPTLLVFTSEKTLLGIQSSNNPLQALKKALEDETISYKAIGFFNKIKFGFSSLFVKIFGSFEAGEEKVLNEKIQPTKVYPVKEMDTKDVGKEKKEEKKEPVKKEVVEDKKPEGKTTHEVEMTSKGFLPKELEINVGDTVKWTNTRTSKPYKAMVIGTQLCRAIKSDFFEGGESFEWTFDKVETCTIVDGIMTTEISKIIVK